MLPAAAGPTSEQGCENVITLPPSGCKARVIREVNFYRQQAPLEIRKPWGTLTSVAPLVGLHPTKPRVTGSIPSQGKVTRLWTQSTVGPIQEATNRCFSLTSMFLSLSFSLPSPFSKNNSLKKTAWGGSEFGKEKDAVLSLPLAPFT